jgi:hypothetical protein
MILCWAMFQFQAFENQCFKSKSLFDTVSPLNDGMPFHWERVIPIIGFVYVISIVGFVLIINIEQQNLDYIICN